MQTYDACIILCAYIGIHEYTPIYIHTVYLSLCLSLCLFSQRDEPFRPGSKGPALWGRPKGPGPLGPAQRAQPFGPGPRGRALWARPRGPRQGSGHCHLTRGPFSLTRALRAGGTIFSGAEGEGGGPLRTMYLTCTLAGPTGAGPLASPLGLA